MPNNLWGRFIAWLIRPGVETIMTEGFGKPARLPEGVARVPDGFPDPDFAELTVVSSVTRAD